MECLGFAGMLTGFSPFRCCTIQIPEYTAKHTRVDEAEAVNNTSAHDKHLQ